jgi:hypothetical protein
MQAAAKTLADELIDWDAVHESGCGAKSRQTAPQTCVYKVVARRPR